MATTNDNPYRSPRESGGEAKKPTSAGHRLIWLPLAIHFLVTLNWGVAVAWLYREALKPGYPLVYDSPPGMQTYVLVSFWASVLFLPTPILIGCMIGGKRAWVLRIPDLAVCAASFVLSGIQLWLIGFTQSPPIHAI